MRSLIALVLIASVPGLVACTEDVNSNDIKTHGMYAGIRAVAHGDGTADVTVDLRVGGNSGTVVDLVAGDQLVATSNGTSTVLAHKGNDYQARIPSVVGGTEIQVAFERGQDDVSAPNSLVVLPEDYNITAPTADASVSRATEVAVSWSPTSSDGMSWDVDGDCIFADSGNLSGGASSVAVKLDPTTTDQNNSCTVTFCLNRTRAGQVDSAFGEGGKFEAVQRRCVKFTSTP